MSLSVQEKALEVHPVVATVCSFLDDKMVVTASRTKRAFQGHTAWKKAREMAIARPLHSIGLMPSLKSVMALSGLYPNLKNLSNALRVSTSLSTFDRLLRKFGERSDISTGGSQLLCNYENTIAHWNEHSFPDIKFTVKDWALFQKFTKEVALLDCTSPHYESDVLAIYRRIMGSVQRNFENLDEMKR